jgi:hypothetical protein
MFRIFALISVVLLSVQFAKANHIEQYDENVILLIGLKASEISDPERGILQGKRVIEVNYTDNWMETIKKTSADEVILKQNSGFTGLYTPNGDLIRNIELIADLYKKQNNLIPPGSQEITYKQQTDRGYSLAGRVDPYQPGTPLSDRHDNKQLQAGYGYNSDFNRPKSKRSIVVDYLDYMPLDTVAPLNYPGHFDQHNLTWAYGLGVIPHIGGFIVARNRARANNKDYEYYKQQRAIPDYVERPVMYQNYNPAEPTNPIVSDPNFVRYQEMPISFEEQY